MKDLNTIREEVTKATGIPEILLTGENPEEIISHAKAVLAFKKRSIVSDQKHKTTTQQFAEWMTGTTQEEQEAAAIDAKLEALAHINTKESFFTTEQTKTPADEFEEWFTGHPKEDPAPVQLRDAGEVDPGQFPKEPVRAFAEWLNETDALKFDPFKNEDGWKRIL